MAIGDSGLWRCVAPSLHTHRSKRNAVLDELHLYNKAEDRAEKRRRFVAPRLRTPVKP